MRRREFTQTEGDVVAVLSADRRVCVFFLFVWGSRERLLELRRGEEYTQTLLMATAARAGKFIYIYCAFSAKRRTSKRSEYDERCMYALWHDVG